ncbi:MAG: GAF domain-containing SpoIIE family protein phosphatase [bacterium]|nr:GAF domain-containing SpoIIE family protein phosphatase [bacterium]
MTVVSKESENILREMSYVTQITQSISEDKPLDVLLNEIMESCKLLMNAEASSLLIYDEAEDHLYFSIATGEKGEGVKNIICKMGEGIAGWVAANRTPLLIEDCYEDPRFNREFDMQSNFRTKSMLCVPMIHREKLIGVIQVINKRHGEIFTERDLNIFQILSSQCAISIENARLINVRIQQEALNRELKTAREIQQNLLPSKFPEFKDIDVSMILIPAKQIGGDYYNIYTVIPDQTLFFICDVSGKSISAALIVSTIFSSIITYFKLNKEFNLIEFVKCLNNVLIDSTTDEKFATCWFGLYNHNDRKLHSINAGHNTIYVFKKNGEKVELNDGGLMLGCVEYDFVAEEITMERDDILFLYTDGVPEAMSKSGEFYGDDRGPELIQKFSDKPANIILKNILRDIEQFTAGADQSDDITCGILKIL